MRLLFAGLFVFAVWSGIVVLQEILFPGNDDNPWWATPVICVGFFAAILAALVIFNLGGHRPPPPSPTLEELQQQDLLTAESFRARRAFQVEEWEDEGSHYFIELDDGRTLYLNGQYLYYFELIEDDPEFNQPRKFPCTEFTILRHKDEEYVVDIQCVGEVLEPECVARPFSKADWKRGVPVDGTIIADRSYDDIKRERISAA